MERVRLVVRHASTSRAGAASVLLASMTALSISEKRKDCDHNIDSRVCSEEQKIISDVKKKGFKSNGDIDDETSTMWRFEQKRCPCRVACPASPPTGLTGVYQGARSDWPKLQAFNALHTKLHNVMPSIGALCQPPNT